MGILDLPDMTLAALFASFCVAALAGLIKGVVGFAMPLILVSGLSSFLDPKLALAGILVPVLVSNAIQTFREGLSAAWDAVQEFYRYLIMVCLSIFLAAQVVAYIPSQVFYFILGVPVVIISVIQLVGFQLTIPPEKRASSEWIIGTISGVMGGLAGTWGPTTVLYLIAIDTPKARQMVVQGVIYGMGSVVLFLAHIQSGILNVETAPFSAILLIPAFAGLWLGFQIQDRLDQKRFKTVTLIVLVVAGLNLIRKGFVG